ncbi:MAG TPA: response regulator [Bryobacteraceae bacterium]|nr:response regulator [Bryobacteraceae bacterium]
MFKILFVDDEESIRSVFAKLLGMHGFSVVTASSAASGIAKLTEDTPDAVITDLRMEMPLAGFQVVEAAALIVPRPVIVVLTAFPVPASHWKSAGADALVVKGMRVGALLDTLGALLNARGLSSSAHAE